MFRGVYIAAAVGCGLLARPAAASTVTFTGYVTDNLCFDVRPPPLPSQCHGRCPERNFCSFKPPFSLDPSLDPTPDPFLIPPCFPRPPNILAHAVHYTPCLGGLAACARKLNMF